MDEQEQQNIWAQIRQAIREDIREELSFIIYLYFDYLDAHPDGPPPPINPQSNTLH